MRFWPADRALGVTGTFVTGAEIHQTQTTTESSHLCQIVRVRILEIDSKKVRIPSPINYIMHTNGGKYSADSRAVITILCDLLAYMGRVSALKPTVKHMD